MCESKKSKRYLMVLMAVLTLSSLAAPALAAEGDAAEAAIPSSMLQYLGAGVGAGIAVIGAGLGIGKLAAAAAEGVARQPQATPQITGAVQLPLFLLEGAAIIAIVTCLLIVLMR